MIDKKYCLLLFALLCGTQFLTGCGSKGDQPDLGLVRGKVTLDGSPFDGVTIVFQPDNGRAGTAIVEKDGTYDLLYAYKLHGAKVGPCTVTFQWPTGSNPTRAIPRTAEFKKEVKKGRNTFDFELVSDEKPDPNRARPIAD